MMFRKTAAVITLAILVAFLGISVSVEARADTLIPQTIESLQSKRTNDGQVRLIQYSEYLFHYMSKPTRTPFKIVVEHWNTERNHLFSRVALEKSITLERINREDRHPEPNLQQWDLNDMDDILIQDFQVSEDKADFTLVLMPSRMGETIRTQCITEIRSKNLHPIRCIVMNGDATP